MSDTQAQQRPKENPTENPADANSTEISQDEIQRTIGQLLNQAIMFADEELEPLRAKMTAYYLREKFGNEDEGRSQFISSEVSDAVDALVPSVVEAIFGPERVVEFEADGPETIAMAEQATVFVQKTFEEQGGFLKTHSAVVDGLVRRLGIFKWGWVEGERCAHKVEGLDAEEAQALLMGEGLEDVQITSDAEGQYTVEYTQQEPGHPDFWSVPPRQLLFDRGARSIADATLVAHRDDTKTTSDLVALGISEKDIEDYGGTEVDATEEERAAAAGLGRVIDKAAEETEAAEKRHLYIESYVRLKDGALRLVRTIGPKHHVVKIEPVSCRPFAAWCPKPEPHEIDGRSIADLTMDLQLVKSSLTRSTLDSLALSIFGRMGFVEGQVSVEDILNTEIGAPIRMRAPGMVQEIKHTFVGADTLPVITYFDEVIERRTGQSQGAAGLDADALQSSTQTAVTAAVTATQQQAKLYTRMFAEQALKPLFQGLLQLMTEHPPKERMLKMRGQWVSVNPATFSPTLSVTTHVGVGPAAVQEKVETLTDIAAKMEQIFATLGPSNPLVTMGQYAELLTDITTLRGIKKRYFNDVPPDWQPPAAPAPPPSPEQVIAQAQMQVEQMRTAKELEIKQAELALKQQVAEREHQRALQKLAQDLELGRLELELKYQTSLTQAQVTAQVEGTKAVIDGQANAAQLNHQAEQANADRTLAAQDQAHGQALAAQGQAHGQALAERQQMHTEGLAARQQDHTEAIDTRDADRQDQLAAQTASDAGSET